MDVSQSGEGEGDDSSFHGRNAPALLPLIRAINSVM